MVAAGTSGPWPAMASAAEALKKEDGSRPYVLGPLEGYTPLVGTLVSMLVYMRKVVLRSVKDATTAQLDFLLDSKANSVGALLLHLAATETYYALHTFDGLAWDSWPDSVKRSWDVPANLGEQARKQRDDAWLMTVDASWPWGPTNTFCKWFHVCEHESNHNGQIKLIARRLPGAKNGGE
jgi:uncharacterized damage-inducible protein DinB